MYVLTKNSRYVKIDDNCPTLTSDILSATMFKTEQLAKGYINNNINKKERYKYSTLNCDKLLLANENYSSIVLHNLYENINIHMDNTLDELNNNLSLYDKQQSDILHYIENTDKIDMYTSWLLTNKLRNIRKQRRIIKNLTNTVRSIKINEADMKGTFINYSSNTNYTCKGFKNYEDIFKAK